MNPDPLTRLFDRCTRADASAADLRALETLLAVQEGRTEPGSAREALEAVLEPGEVDGLLGVATGWASLTTAIIDLCNGLNRAASSVDVSHEVIAEVAPESPFERAVEALSSGIASDARHLDVSGTVLADLGTAARPEASLAEAVAAEAGAPPCLADAVMERVMTEDVVPMEIMALVDGMLPADRIASVTARLAADPMALKTAGALAALGRDLRSALRAEAPTPSDIWPPVARALGFEREVAWGEAMAGLSTALSASAPDVAGSVMEAIAPAPIPAPAPVRQIRRTPSVSVLAVFAAATAATLLVVNVVRSPFVGEVQEAVQDVATAFSTEPPIVLADLNETRIDDLQVNPGAMVQVFQFEGGAPLVIYVDEGLSGGAVL